MSQYVKKPTHRVQPLDVQPYRQDPIISLPVRFERNVQRLMKTGDQAFREMTPAKVHYLHLGVAISGEAGEIADALKKAAMYGKVLDIQNIEEEVGDILFYLQSLCEATGLTLSGCMEANIKKLNLRYPEGYSDKAAQQRADKQLDGGLTIAMVPHHEQSVKQVSAAGPDKKKEGVETCVHAGIHGETAAAGRATEVSS